MKILTAQQMRNWDEYTIAHEPISSIDLMERAARACVDWLDMAGKIRDHVLIFCGKGNNGGDGLAIARLLSGSGTTVTVFILEFGHLGTDDFQANLARLHQCVEVGIKYIQEPAHFPEIKKGQTVIDALYGSGLNRPLTGLSAQLVSHINSFAGCVVSIDLPSGLSANGNPATSDVVQAVHTLTFQTWKASLLSPDNASCSGAVHVLDIGLHPDYYEATGPTDRVISNQLVREIYTKRKPFAHKGSFGHSLIIAGSYGKMGAAVLAARSCLHTGTGLLTVHVPSSGYTILQATVPEAMVLTDQNTSNFTGDVADADKYTCIGIGPGLGTEKMTRTAVQDLLRSANRPIVLDADALNILAMDPALMTEVPPKSILTPHPKEFDRLFGKTGSAYAQQQLAREKAAEFKVIIILKGHHTMIALPEGIHRGGTAFFNINGNPGMATGGSGDVLTGMLTSVISQGYEPADAAILGVYLHGLAGDLAADALSEESLSAGDMINFLPPAFQHLGELIS